MFAHSFLPPSIQSAEDTYKLAMDHKEEMFDEEYGTAYKLVEDLDKNT